MSAPVNQGNCLGCPSGSSTGSSGGQGQGGSGGQGGQGGGSGGSSTTLVPRRGCDTACDDVACEFPVGSRKNRVEERCEDVQEPQDIADDSEVNGGPQPDVPQDLSDEPEEKRGQPPENVGDRDEHENGEDKFEFGFSLTYQLLAFLIKLLGLVADTFRILPRGELACAVTQDMDSLGERGPRAVEEFLYEPFPKVAAKSLLLGFDGPGGGDGLGGDLLCLPLQYYRW
ncbi:hypothetical protein PG984_014740 [Apiospora sp. TS-2023a]